MILGMRLGICSNIKHECHEEAATCSKKFPWSVSCTKTLSIIESAIQNTGVIIWTQNKYYVFWYVKFIVSVPLAWQVRKRSQPVFPISKLVSENSLFHFVQEPTEKQPVYEHSVKLHRQSFPILSWYKKTLFPFKLESLRCILQYTQE